MAQQIVIDIVAETKKLTQGLNDAETEIGSLSKKVKGLTSAAAAAASAFVLKQGISFLKQGVEEAEDARKAMLGAESAFGKGSKALQQITSDAEKFGKALGIDNDDIIKLSTQLGSRLPADSKILSAQLVNLAKDVEAVTAGAVSAETVTNKLAKAFADGSISAKELQKIVPDLAKSVYDQAEALSKAGKNQEALTLIIDAAQKKYGDAAEKNVTSTQKFETALANFKETLGTKVLPFLEKLIDIATKVLEIFDKQPKIFQNVELALLAIVAVGGPLLTFLASAKTAMITLGLASEGASLGINLVKVALAGLGIGLAIAALVLLIQNWDKVKEAATALWEKIKEVFGNIKDWIVNTAGAVKDWLEKNWPLILGVLTGPFGLFAAWIITHREELITKFNELWDKVKTAIGDKVSGVVTSIKDKFHTLVFETIPGIFKNVGTQIGNTWGDISSAVGGIVKKIGDAFSNIFKDMFTVGTLIAKGIWSGLFSLDDWFKAKLADWVKRNIPDWVKFVLKIQSPSKVMEQIGKYTVQGLYKGMGVVGKPGIQLPQINVPAGAGAGVNITINAGLGTDPIALGRQVQQALTKYGKLTA